MMTILWRLEPLLRCLIDFFDCFNARCVSECVPKRKPDLRPYRDPCDTRPTVSYQLFLKMINL